jgi:chaperonin GroES
LSEFGREERSQTAPVSVPGEKLEVPEELKEESFRWATREEADFGEEIARLQVLKDYVFVLPLAVDEKTEGGIIRPEKWRKRTLGKVVACGPGKLNDKGVLIPTEVQVGDTVWLPRIEGLQEFYLWGGVVVVRHEEDILGVVEDDRPA